MLPTSKSSLGRDVIEAIVEAKRLFQQGRLRRHEGLELSSALRASGERTWWSTEWGRRTLVMRVPPAGVAS